MQKKVFENNGTPELGFSAPCPSPPLCCPQLLTGTAVCALQDVSGSPASPMANCPHTSPSIPGDQNHALGVSGHLSQLCTELSCPHPDSHWDKAEERPISLHVAMGFFLHISASICPVFPALRIRVCTKHKKPPKHQVHTF